MTYLDSYRECNTVDELVAKVRHDVLVAKVWHVFLRLPSIRQALNTVLEEKHWSMTDELVKAME